MNVLKEFDNGSQLYGQLQNPHSHARAVIAGSTRPVYVQVLENHKIQLVAFTTAGAFTDSVLGLMSFGRSVAPRNRYEIKDRAEPNIPEIFSAVHGRRGENEPPSIQGLIDGTPEKLEVALQAMDPIRLHEFLNTPDGRGFTPLLWACHESKFDMIPILISYGADPNKIAEPDGRSTTVVHELAREGAFDVLQKLLADDEVSPQTLQVRDGVRSDGYGDDTVLDCLCNYTKPVVGGIRQPIDEPTERAIDELVQTLIRKEVSIDYPEPPKPPPHPVDSEQPEPPPPPFKVSPVALALRARHFQVAARLSNALRHARKELSEDNALLVHYWTTQFLDTCLDTTSREYAFCKDLRASLEKRHPDLRNEWSRPVEQHGSLDLPQVTDPNRRVLVEGVATTVAHQWARCGQFDQLKTNIEFITRDTLNSRDGVRTGGYGQDTVLDCLCNYTNPIREGVRQPCDETTEKALAATVHSLVSTVGVNTDYVVENTKDLTFSSPLVLALRGRHILTAMEIFDILQRKKPWAENLGYWIVEGHSAAYWAKQFLDSELDTTTRQYRFCQQLLQQLKDWGLVARPLRPHRGPSYWHFTEPLPVSPPAEAEPQRGQPGSSSAAAAAAAPAEPPPDFERTAAVAPPPPMRLRSSDRVNALIQTVKAGKSFQLSDEDLGDRDLMSQAITDLDTNQLERFLAAQDRVSLANVINQVDSQGFTPLLRACYESKFDMILPLVRRGANPNMDATIGKRKTTVAHELAREGALNVLYDLVENNKIDPATLNTRDGEREDGYGQDTVLDCLCNYTNPLKDGVRQPCDATTEQAIAKTVTLLLFKGATFDYVDSTTGESAFTSPLALAVRAGHMEAANVLSQKLVKTGKRLSKTDAGTLLYWITQRIHRFPPQWRIWCQDWRGKLERLYPDLKPLPVESHPLLVEAINRTDYNSPVVQGGRSTVAHHLARRGDFKELQQALSRHLITPETLNTRDDKRPVDNRPDDYGDDTVLDCLCNYTLPQEAAMSAGRLERERTLNATIESLLKTRGVRSDYSAERILVEGPEGTRVKIYLAPLVLALRAGHILAAETLLPTLKTLLPTPPLQDSDSEAASYCRGQIHRALYWAQQWLSETSPLTDPERKLCGSILGELTQWNDTLQPARPLTSAWHFAR